MLLASKTGETKRTAYARGFGAPKRLIPLLSPPFAATTARRAGTSLTSHRAPGCPQIKHLCFHSQRSPEFAAQTATKTHHPAALCNPFSSLIPARQPGTRPLALPAAGNLSVCHRHGAWAMKNRHRPRNGCARAGQGASRALEGPQRLRFPLGEPRATENMHTVPTPADSDIWRGLQVAQFY